MQPTTNRKVRITTAALAAALLAVPVAQARVPVDARHAALFNKQVAQQPVVRTDAHHAALLNKVHGYRVIVQESTLPKITQGERPSADTSVGTASTGFDWSDAGVGAGVVLGLVMVAGAGVLVTRRKLVSA
jgi:hypothetical protein